MSASPETLPAPPCARVSDQPARTGLKILCFPHAGGGASSFRAWRSGLPSGCVIVPVCPPGREGRFATAIPEQLEALLSDILDQESESMTGPFAILGHSMGALVGFEFARYLRRMGRPGPVHLFVSAFRAPHLPARGAAMSSLSDSELAISMVRLQGTPREILQQSELLRLLLPILRADLRICDRYRCQPEPPLECPISCFAGQSDTHVRPEETSGWRVHTRGTFRHHVLPGGHFFLHRARKIVLAKVLVDLDFRHRFGIPAIPIDPCLSASALSGSPPRAESSDVGSAGPRGTQRIEAGSD